MKRSEHRTPPPWQRGRFTDTDNDPLTGFANIMDVMLVFALGLMLALISQSQEMRQRFKLDDNREVAEGRELVEAPEAISKLINGQANGMKALGQVYRDPESGKLILVGAQ